MQRIIGFRVDGSGQPVLFVVESEHGLVDRDVIKRPTSLEL